MPVSATVSSLTVLILEVLAFSLAAVVTLIACMLLPVLIEWLEEPSSEWILLLRLLIGAALPLLAGIAAAATVRRRFLVKRQPAGMALCGGFGLLAVASRARAVRWKRALLWLAIFGYVITGVAGVPAVQSSVTQEAVEEFQRISAEGHRPQRQWYPGIRTYVGLPLAPGIILIYHEYSLAQLNAWGGWSVHAWYVGGSRELFNIPSWVS